jgi:hypothetical protein
MPEAKLRLDMLLQATHLSLPDSPPSPTPPLQPSQSSNNSPPQTPLPKTTVDSLAKNMQHKGVAVKAST